jgi:hypothetical protein
MTALIWKGKTQSFLPPGQVYRTELSNSNETKAIQIVDGLGKQSSCSLVDPLCWNEIGTH